MHSFCIGQYKNNLEAVIMQKLTRTINIGFRVTEEEREMIYKRMEQAKMSNLRAYLLKMAIDGSVIQIDLTNVNECSRLLRNISGNINQIAKRINETSNIYATDIEEIKVRQDEIWEQQEKIIKSLTKLVEAVWWLRHGLNQFTKENQ